MLQSPFLKLQLQLQFFVVLRGPSWTKVLQLPFLKSKLQFFVVLRGPSWTKGVAVAILKLQLPFSVALRVLRGQRCCSCRCSSSRPFVVLRGPSWTKVLPLPCWSCGCRSPCPPWTKGFDVAVLKLQLQFFAALRGPSRPFVDKGVAVAVHQKLRTTKQAPPPHKQTDTRSPRTAAVHHGSCPPPPPAAPAGSPPPYPAPDRVIHL